MIRSMAPLSMAEASSYLAEDETQVRTFIKDFSSLSDEEAKELRAKLNGLEFIKLNDKNIAKIIDLLPKDKEDLNKVFIDVNLDENETNTILETIKEYK